MQSIYYQKSPKNSIELIEIVEDAFKNYPMEKLNKIWLTLQSCMDEIIKEQGGNKYKIPHMSKDKLIRNGTLPVVLNVSPEAQQACWEYLNELVPEPIL